MTWTSRNFCWLTTCLTVSCFCRSNGITFTFVEPGTISRIVPTCGPVSGGTLVTLYGANFVQSRRIICSFGPAIVFASQVNSTQAVCIAPAQLSPGVVALNVSNNGADFEAG